MARLKQKKPESEEEDFVDYKNIVKTKGRDTPLFLVIHRRAIILLLNLALFNELAISRQKF